MIYEIWEKYVSFVKNMVSTHLKSSQNQLFLFTTAIRLRVYPLLGGVLKLKNRANYI